MSLKPKYKVGDILGVGDCHTPIIAIFKRGDFYNYVIKATRYIDLEIAWYELANEKFISTVPILDNDAPVYYYYEHQIDDAWESGSLAFFAATKEEYEFITLIINMRKEYANAE